MKTLNRLFPVPLREGRDAVQGNSQLLLVGGVAGSDKSFTGFAEGGAGHYGDFFLFEQTGGEFPAGHAGAADVREGVERALRHAAADARNRIEPVDQHLIVGLTGGPDRVSSPHAAPPVGVVASLYAGYLNPEFRVTASQLSAVINGFATILLFALIDPQLSVMTDDVVEGRMDAALFRRAIIWVSLSRFAGTGLAQLLFVPAAFAIAWVANYV